MAKEVIEEGMQVDLDTGLMLETKAVGVTHATEDRKEGMNAFKEKRKAVFQVNNISKRLLDEQKRTSNSLPSFKKKKY